jgi:hypothetical protein
VDARRLSSTDRPGASPATSTASAARHLPWNIAARLAVFVLLSAAVSVEAHVNSGANCASCHSSARQGMRITGFQLSTNLGSGVRKVFQVRPGETATVGVNVTDGHNEYGLALVNLAGGGMNDASHHLSYSADPAWTKRTSYFSLGPKTVNQAWAFRLGVLPETPPDLYLLYLRMAGTGGGRWNQEEAVYVQVLRPVPPAPQITNPRLDGPTFSCDVATIAGFTYRLEYKPTPEEASWTTANEVPGDGNLKRLTDPMATVPHRLYRVRVE